MSQAIGSEAGDDLVRLWQETRLPSPDPEQLARRVAGMALRRFDRAIAWRNFREYAGSVLALLFAVLQWRVTGDRLQPLALVGAVAFVSGVLWSQHRRIRRLDPSADARAYQAALLARIDQQTRLLSNVRYWYLLPLYLPALIQTANSWHRHPVGAFVMLAIVTAAFALVGWLNERVAVGLLRSERDRVAALYTDDEA